MASSKKVLVVGAGLVGSAWAILLAKRGYQVEVFERRGDMRNAAFVGGRSINLAMSTRGWKAMEKAGIKDKIRSVAIPMRGRMMHDTSGQLTFQPYSREDQAIYSVSRGGLNIELLKIADEHANVQLHFHEKCRYIDLKSGTATFENTETGVVNSSKWDLIFGADGAFSAVRRSLQRRGRFNFSQQYLEHGYKELTIPAGNNQAHLLEKNALHIWPRKSFMLIALPNQDGSFTCTLFLPFDGVESFNRLQSDEDILAFFNKYFPDALALIPDLLENFRSNPTSALVTIRCNPWRYKEQVLLIGDASHAIVPFYGQGMNSGFEDCTILDELMDKYGDQWGQIIENFNQSRIKDANAIADLALRNFIEMRDQVADPLFLLRKKLEAHLQKKYDKDFIPVYSMVTFSHLPYSEALQESYYQDELFKKLLALPGIAKNWQGNTEVDRIFQDWLASKK